MNFMMLWMTKFYRASRMKVSANLITASLRGSISIGFFVTTSCKVDDLYPAHVRHEFVV